MMEEDFPDIGMFNSLWGVKIPRIESEDDIFLCKHESNFLE